MEAVYVPQQRSSAGTNLREAAAKYITNGRYNPMHSVVIAEEYKQRREQADKKRRDRSKEQSMIFSDFNDLIKSKIRY